MAHSCGDGLLYCAACTAAGDDSRRYWEPRFQLTELARQRAGGEPLKPLNVTPAKPTGKCQACGRKLVVDGSR